jgi:hypothetical protein
MPNDELPGEVPELPAPCEPAPAPAGGLATAEPASARQEAAAILKVCFTLIFMSLPFLFVLSARLRLIPSSRSNLRFGVR